MPHARAASCPSRLCAPCPSRPRAPCPRGRARHAPCGCARHAPCGCARHALRGCVRHAPSTVAVASRAHSVPSSLPRAPTPRTLQWWLPQPPPASSTLAGLSVRAGTARALRRIPQWIAVRDAAADRRARRSSGLPCATQRRIAVCDAAAIAVRGTAAARGGSPRVRYGVPGTRRRVFSLPGTRRRVPRVPATPTLKYPYPGCRVRVFRGWGRGSLSQPQGYPCQSLDETIR